MAYTTMQITAHNNRETATVSAGATTITKDAAIVISDALPRTFIRAALQNLIDLLDERTEFPPTAD